MKLEICVHCYRYAKLLSFQLSSLVRFPPSYEVTMTVMYCDEDERTKQVLRDHQQIAVKNVAFNFWKLKRPYLLRRAIGRNTAAINTQADWIWFADCDLLFWKYCLDSLPASLEKVSGPLAFPSVTLVTSQERGSDLIAKVSHPAQEPWFQQRDFTLVPGTSNAGRATGAIQIVRGDVAREKGYLPCHPIHSLPSETWQRTYCDVEFRRYIGGGTELRGQPIDVPGLLRIRHLVRGRDTPEIEL